MEIKAITVEQLWFRSYQNHLKNLRIKVMIANFVILILLVEIGTRVCFLFQNRCRLYVLLKLQVDTHCHTNCSIMLFLNNVLNVSTMESYFPLLCLLVKVLWLVYLHSPYKYSVRNWTAYIMMKIIAVYVCDLLLPVISKFMYGYSVGRLIEIISIIVQSFFMIFEYITYLVYSRRFYLLLRGIEIESKLSLDRSKYLESKFVRIHFKVCTILIAIAFLCRIISGLSLIQSNVVQRIFTLFPDIKLGPALKILIQGVDEEKILLLYRFLSNLNYLYMFYVILLQYFKKRNNRNINDKIKPLVRAHQDKIFTRRDYYRNS